MVLSLFALIISWSLLKDVESGLVRRIPYNAADKPDPRQTTGAELLKESNEFQGWTVLVMGGVIALLVTTKVHSNSNPEWSFILFGPAFVFLGTSFLAAWELKKRYNYLLVHNNFEDLNSLAKHLSAQFTLLSYSGIVLVVFGGSFLIQIILRKIKPDQKESS